MDNLVDLLLVALAAGAIVEIARHDPRLSEKRVQWETAGHWSGKLLTCGFCFSYWAAAAAVLLLPIHPIVLWLAAVRLSNLISDLSHACCRSPRRPESSIDLLQPEEQSNG
jgi:hypothetical protein